jgi:selenocysteine lyase/cysteine desulfurase
MIYFDNAATSRPKPEPVYQAYDFFIREIGTSPGRGSYSLAIQASRMLYQSRKAVAHFFGSTDPSCVVFTKNSTEAINLFFNGYLKKGDHVIISPYEHNAVLRPLQTLKDRGVISYSVLPESVLYSSGDVLKNYVHENTKLIALMLASNLTGQRVFSTALSQKAHQLGLTVFVDASQGAGKKLINLVDDEIDVLAFTGHKDLWGVPGVGGLVSQNGLRLTPLIQGGTGIHGESYVNPEIYPDSYESGTLNMPAIWALKVALEYDEKTAKKNQEIERRLVQYAIEKLLKNERVIVYNPNYDRVSTFCFNVLGVPSSDVVQILDNHGICVRGGIHCAIKAHETLGTVETGAVRVSLSAFNTLQEIDKFVNVIEGIEPCI